MAIMVFLSKQAMRFSHFCGATKSVLKRQNYTYFQQSIHRRRADQTKRTMMLHWFAYPRWKRYNQSLSELSRLGDRELADIGISRSDIARVAWNAAHKN
jgi:uncharacterized protein YjiS (DUF1127 family)